MHAGGGETAESCGVELDRKRLEIYLNFASNSLDFSWSSRRILGIGGFK